MNEEGWESPIKHRTMIFGKYRGTALRDVPADYLQFLLANNYAGRMRATIIEHLALRER